MMRQSDRSIFIWLTMLAVLAQRDKCALGAPRCHCMRVKDCNFFANGGPPYQTSNRLLTTRKADDISCGFDGVHALVCCSAAAQHSHQRRSAASSAAGFFDDDDHPWVWGRRPLAPPTVTEGTARGIIKKFDFDEQEANFGKSAELMDLFNYKDKKTSRNCPPVFYEDDEYDSNNYYYFPTKHAHDDSSAEDSKSVEEFDKPFVFPDDSRLLRPIYYPDSTHIAALHFAKRIGTAKPNVPSVNSVQCGLPLPSTNMTDQFPWIARIGYLNKTSNRISYRCSGSLVNGLHVLTAAHCVIDLVGDLELAHVRIAEERGTTVTLQIDKVIVHPSYDRPQYANDIALLRIKRTASSASSNTTSICLPLNDSTGFMERLIGRIGIVAVWGANKDGVENINTTVKYLRLPIVNTTECAITYAKFSENSANPIVIAPKQLCAQGQPQNDVCRGDSGGPFMDDADGRYTLLGIVTFGPLPCGISNFPGVYTRVSSYLSWIQSNIEAV